MELKLPPAIVGQVDINRMLRELAGLDSFFISANARQAGASPAPPRITYQLQQLAKENKVNLLEEVQRAGLKTTLQQVLKTAPLLHISFAAEPTPRVAEQILGWLRTNIHPQTLLTVGLQPTIAAGCVLRTSNKIFDMSLRSNLQSRQDYLVKLIQGAASGSR